MGSISCQTEVLKYFLMEIRRMMKLIEKNSGCVANARERFNKCAQPFDNGTKKIEF